LQGAVAGGLLFGQALCHGWAISMTKADCMIAVKRLSILFGVIYGGIFFHERHLLYRVAGTCLMGRRSGRSHSQGPANRIPADPQCRMGAGQAVIEGVIVQQSQPDEQSQPESQAGAC
jgi:hypothetical protein